MLTGRPPFRAERSLAILNRICNEPHRRVREVNPDVPAPVARLVDRLLEKDVAKRFSQAEEVRGECLRLLKQPTHVEARLANQPQARVRSRRSRLPQIALVGVLLIVAVSAARERLIWSQLFRAEVMGASSHGAAVAWDSQESDAHGLPSARPVVGRAAVASTRDQPLPALPAAARYDPGVIRDELEHNRNARAAIGVYGSTPELPTLATPEPAAFATPEESSRWMADLEEVQRAMRALQALEHGSWRDSAAGQTGESVHDSFAAELQQIESLLREFETAPRSLTPQSPPIHHNSLPRY